MTNIYTDYDKDKSIYIKLYNKYINYIINPQKHSCMKRMQGFVCLYRKKQKVRNLIFLKKKV